MAATIQTPETEIAMTKTDAGPNPMPITLQPGAAALVALMKADPGFAVDIKKGVVAEVVRQLMPKNMEQVLMGTITAEVEKARSKLVDLFREGKTIDQVMRDELGRAVEAIRNTSYAAALSKADPSRAMISRAVQDTLVSAVREAVDASMAPTEGGEGGSALQVAIRKRVEAMEARITGSMGQRIEDEVVKRIGIAEEAEIARRVDERLQAIRTALSA